MHRFSNVFVAFICFAFFGIPDAFAESAVHPFITSKFTVQAGLYYPTQDINLRVDGSLGGVLTAGSSVTGGTGQKITRMFFGRAFDSSLQYDYGLGIGIHRIEIEALIGEDIIINFGETAAVSASGPLPNIGGWYYYSPSEKWYLGGRLDWFQVSVGDYAGGLVNFSTGANYQMFKHVGIGLNYQIVSLNADVKNSNWRGRVESKFSGFSINLSGNW